MNWYKWKRMCFAYAPENWVDKETKAELCVSVDDEDGHWIHIAKCYVPSQGLYILADPK